MALRDKQRKMLAAIRDMEREGRRLAVDDFVARVKAATGYKDVRTYLTKYLEGAVVHRRDSDGTVTVEGAVALSEDDFAKLLTQKRLPSEIGGVPAYESREEWAEAMRALASAGDRRGYYLDEGDADLFLDLFDRPDD